MSKPKATAPTSGGLSNEATAVVAAPKTAIALPDYMKSGNRGNEDVTTQDVVIPRLELAQALSPCLDKTLPAYIKGAEQGMLYNSLTRELYGEYVQICPVLFRKEWLVWRDRKVGGGFRGAYPTIQDANARIADEEKPEELEAVETAQNIVLIVKPDGTTQEAVISMARTKLKVAKQFNSLIRLNGGDRFSRLYTLFGSPEKNAAGEKYYNYGIQNVGFAPKDVYLAAEAFFEAVSSGSRKVVLDNDNVDDDGTSHNRESGEF